MPRKERLSRGQKARREAVVGAFAGAALGGGLWACFDRTTPTLLQWTLLPAVFFGLVFHHNEWLDG